MRWLVFAILAWIFIGLEIGLRDVLAFGEDLAISPSLVLPLAALVALSATPRQTLVACLVLGLLVDLTSSHELADAGGAVTIIGPAALGYMLAGKFVLTMRGLMIRHNPLTLVFLSIVGAMLVNAVIAAMLSIRAIYDPIVWDGGGELLVRLGRSIYTGAPALLVGLISPLLGAMLGLDHPPRHGRRVF